jgi:hypothetical protein
MSDIDQILVASIALESVFLLVLLYVWRVLGRVMDRCRRLEQRTAHLNTELRAVQLRSELTHPVATRIV